MALSRRRWHRSQAPGRYRLARRREGESALQRKGSTRLTFHQAPSQSCITGCRTMHHDSESSKNPMCCRQMRYPYSRLNSVTHFVWYRITCLYLIAAHSFSLTAPSRSASASSLAGTHIDADLT